MPDQPTWGGARVGAGTPQRRIQLSLQTARVLREIVRRWQTKTPEAKYTPARVVEDLIYREAIELGAPDPATHADWVRVEKGSE